MSVRLSNEVEIESIFAQQRERDKPSWEIYRTLSIVDAAHRARKLGWGEDKVQIRREHIADNATQYVIEPYEEGCSCRGLLKYDDFFSPNFDSDDG